MNLYADGEHTRWYDMATDTHTIRLYTLYGKVFSTFTVTSSQLCARDLPTVTMLRAIGYTVYIRL